ncbi:MAG: hypothetical protein EOM22_08465 [Gammaproteobacteria bacterium]|nr:hypothetical protein [Gammaproteobacteria bacterium]
MAFQTRVLLLGALLILSPLQGLLAEDRAWQDDVRGFVETPDAAERHQALIEQATEQGRIPVIVALRFAMTDDATLDEAASQLQRDRLAELQQRVVGGLSSAARLDERALGLKLFSYTPALALQADAFDLMELLANPDVVEILEDRPVPPTLADSLPLIGADSSGAFNGYTGQGHVVAILDTGVAKTHPFLSGKVVSEACYSSTVPSASATSLCPGGVPESTATGSGVNCPTTTSGCDHGTHVAGIAAGRGTSFSGVAKDANLIAIQVFSQFTGASCGSAPSPCVLSYTSDQIKGLERVYALRGSYSIASSNMSLGGGQYTSPCDGDSRKAIVDLLRGVGIATVIASGNNSYTSALSAPACISSAVSVGSTTKQDVVSSFSNSASFLDLLAPGSSIQSSVPASGYATKSGTSMAAPHVAGAWAVLDQVKSTATVDEVLNALMTTGQPIIDTRPGADSRIKPRIQVDEAVLRLLGGDCAATTAVNAAPDRETWLDLLDGVRDRVLAGSAEGRALIETYYKHSDEVSEQLRSNPRLIVQALSVLRLLRADLQAAVAGQPIALTGQKSAAVRSMALALRQQASPGLQTDLDAFLRMDLRQLDLGYISHSSR